MRGLSVGQKLMSAFGLVALLMLIVAVIIQWTLNSLNSANSQATMLLEQSSVQLEREVDHLQWVNQLANSMLLNRRFEGQLDHNSCQFGRWINNIQSSPLYREGSHELRSAIDALDEPHQMLHQTARDILGASDSSTATSIYANDTLRYLESIRAEIGSVRAVLIAESERLVQESEQQSNQTKWIVWFMLALVIALSLFVATALRNNISTPLKALKERSQAIANGDLTGAKLTLANQDEVGETTEAFNYMQQQLNELVLNLSASATQLAASADTSSEYSAKADSVLNHQASEIEQLATAMNQMSATITEVAEHAQMTSEASESSRVNTEKSRAVVENVISAINSLADEVTKASNTINTLKEESVNIGSILDTIEGIAEQTNLLALNAAIEAARAGEQGRGFAVVADEVRTLASRTAASTSEIKAMIERLQSAASKSVQTMSAGVELAQHSVEQAADAGKALSNIGDSVMSITDMTHQIATATEEQAMVVEEMNRNISRVNDLTEETRASSRDSDTAASEVSKQAAGLLSITHKFKVNQ